MKHAHAAPLAFLVIAAAACTPSSTLQPRSAGAMGGAARARESVARACLDVPDELQAICPIERGHVLAVKTVREPVSPKGRDFLVGATLYVPASPGTTAEWLGHRIACYQARLIDLPPAPANCPVVEAPAKVRVDGTSNGFAVTVKSDDLDTARAILRTSEAFAN